MRNTSMLGEGSMTGCRVKKAVYRKTVTSKTRRVHEADGRPAGGRQVDAGPAPAGPVAARHPAVEPPSMETAAPVMKPAASEAR
jgi:hypothetical protein